MRYSQILGEVFYNIGLSDGDQALIDVHFTAAAHHYIRMQEATKLSWHRFHSQRLHEHLYHLRRIVFEYGDFIAAKDESLRGLDQRKTWNPEKAVGLIDPKMFNSMQADPDFGVAQAHPCDIYLFDGLASLCPAKCRLIN